MNPVDNPGLEEQEFNIDDIIREFGGNVPTEEEQPEQQEEPSDEAQVSVGSGTTRFEPVQSNKPDVNQDTVSFEPVQPDQPETVGQDTVSFAPVDDQRTQPLRRPEPFAEDPEPDFEGPGPRRGTIAFQDRERLRQQRRKIVEGPEQRYYELMEKGTGKLRFLLVVNTLLFLAVAATTVLHAMGLFDPERVRLLVFTQFFGMLISALMGCGQIIDGFFDLFRLRFTPKSLLVFTFAAACVDGVLCLQQQRVSIAAVFCLEISMALWSTLHSRSTEIKQMETMRHAVRLDRVVCVPDYHEGTAGFCSERGEIEDFMDHYKEMSTPEKVLCWYCFSVLLCSLALTVTAGVLHGVETAAQFCVAALMLGLPATAFVTLSRPEALLENRLYKLGAVLCGWQGIRAVGHKGIYPVEGRDLFPAGSVKLNGVKFYNDSDPDWVVSLAAALIKQSGGALVAPFSQLLNSRDGRFMAVTDFKGYDGGVGGTVGGCQVLVGIREFMQAQGVDLKEAPRVGQAVYVAVEGTLRGQFVVNYRKQKEAAMGLQTLSSYRGLVPMVLSDDFMLTEDFIAHRLGISTRYIRFPKREVFSKLLGCRPGPGDTVVAVTIREGLAPKAFAVTGARVLKSAMKTGVTVHLIGGILGLLIAAVFAIVGMGDILTPTNVLLYELIWMVPGLLISHWTKHI